MFLDIANENKYGSISNDRIDSFEKEFNVKLPIEYRAFLLKYNGGKPKNINFKYGNEIGSIHEDLYGLHNGPKYLQLHWNYKNYCKRIPKGFIPIASDPFGNQICINENGKVFFWDHELEGKSDCVYKLNKNFECFLSELFTAEPVVLNQISTIIKNDDVDKIASLLSSGFDIDAKDENGDTLLELAAIKNSPRTIQFLYEHGAKIGNALVYAEENAKFFKDHLQCVSLLKKLYSIR